MFSVDASEYALVTEFGAPVRVVKESGLHFKYPHQSVRVFDNRLSVFVPPPSEHLTLEKTPVLASTAVLWRIADPQRFFETVFDQAGAESRLGDIVYAELGAAIGRSPLQAFVTAEPGAYRVLAVLEGVRRAAATAARRDYGIELTDVVLQGFEFPKQNRARLYARMKSERGQLSMRYRSEGEEEGLRIRTASEGEKSRILSEALGLAQRSRADGEGEGARIAAQAFDASPEYYRFLRALEAARGLARSSKAMVLPVESDLFGLLLSSRWNEAEQAAVPGVASGP
ncbi:MAG TPA: protease modulator HflC [Acetobacteraceae bacterium]|nr:protease modulator HflC [Acetobacteraceae bacterium]